MEIVGAVVGSLLPCICNPSCEKAATERCKYVMNPTKELTRLRKKTKELIDQANDVNTRLLHSTEVNQEKVPTNMVKNWFEDIEDIKSKMNSIEDKVREVRSLDCWSRSKLGHDISKLITKVTDLFEKGSQFSDDSLAFVVPKKAMKFPTTALVGAQKSIEMVWDCLMDDKVRTVGVYGMGGVGKTTIMKEINNLLSVQRHFDKVIWVTVSKDWSIRKLQQDIAMAFHLVLSNQQDEAEWSRFLFHAMEQTRRFALILDDVWEPFVLHKIGIPEPTEDNGCKIILTTRSLEVCRRMGCYKDNSIQINVLSKEEAWQLFSKNVDVEFGPELREIAENVVDECACLPLAIITIGGLMKGNDDLSEWRVALNDLRKNRYQVNEMDDDVFKSLKFSYDRLIDEKLRHCFLYCALYPEDFKINTKELIDYWISEGLIKENNRQDELDQGHLILNKLKRHCLLESVGTDSKEVKMRDLIREMALYITKECFIVKAGIALKELPDEDEWPEDSERASFMRNEISKISASPECPKLCTLFLNENSDLHNISQNFFIHMQGLKVLNLRDNIMMEVLPEESFSYLVNLRALCLSGCKKLKKVPSLAKLRSLRMLELNYTDIEELPHGLEMLVNLKCLDLGRTKLRQTFPPGLIAKLSLLEELNLFGMRNELYEVGEESTFVKELLSLRYLESLQVDFRCLSDLASYVGLLGFKGLKQFHLETKDHRWKYLYTNASRSVSVSSSNDMPVDAFILPQNTEVLRIANFNDLTSLYELSRRVTALGCLNLRECHIVNCEKLECIISLSEEDHNKDSLLQQLKTLVIHRCPEFYSFCKGIPNRTRIPLLCLKELRIVGCRNVKTLFSSTKTLQVLQNLERVSVSGCDELEELIVSEEEMSEGSSSEAAGIFSRNTISLPKLKLLEFYNLPKLKSIWNGEMVCDSLQIVQIYYCYELKWLPPFSGLEQSPPPSLQLIKVKDKEWWDSLEWDDHAFLKYLLQPLFRG